MQFLITYLCGNKRITTPTEDDKIHVMVEDEADHKKLIIKALDKIVVTKVCVAFDYKFKDSDSVFLNGYQSATDSREFNLNESLNDLKQIPFLTAHKYAFKNFGDYAFYEYGSGVLHSWDVGYVRSDKGQFIGNNIYSWAGLIIEYRPKENKIHLVSDINEVKMAKGEERAFIDAVVEDFEDTSEIKYFDKFTPRTTEKLTSYSTWYNYEDKIDEKIITDDVKALSNAFNLFIIEDGYQSKIGDWKYIDLEKFPNGLKSIVNKIHEKGAKAGIWIAPFIVQAESRIVKERPWWLKAVNGKPVKCGANWGGFYALDFYNDEARKYVQECLNFYKDMGFDCFKLDYLYAVSLPLYDGKNRSQVAYESYKFLRDILGDKIIIGAGCNMAPSFGLFDYVKVGPNISLEWDDAWISKKAHRERNSTRVAIVNTLYRSIFNGKVFMNDPDIILIKKESKLTPEQQESLSMINVLFGSNLAISEDLTTFAPLYRTYDKKMAKLLDKIISIRDNATNAKFTRKNNKITITYELEGSPVSMEYDPDNGVLKEL